MDQITHEVWRTNWLNIVNQCQERPDGMSVKQWLAENDIKEKSYYYWFRKFRKEAYNQMQLPTAVTKQDVTFAEVTLPVAVECTGMKDSMIQHDSAAAVIRCGGLTIELSNNISERLLSHLLQEVSHA
jgi:putative transposase